MQKILGTNFILVAMISHSGRRGRGGVCMISHRVHRGARRSLYYLAQRTQRARRHSSLPTSDFMLPTSYSVIPCRVLAPGAWNLRVCHMMDSRWLAQRTQRARRHPYPSMYGESHSMLRLFEFIYCFRLQTLATHRPMGSYTAHRR